MILYHGSNVEVKEIDLNRSEVGKDFGVGFYLTASKEQAERMASRRVRLYGGGPVVSAFEFDEAAAVGCGAPAERFSVLFKGMGRLHSGEQGQRYSEADSRIRHSPRSHCQ